MWRVLRETGARRVAIEDPGWAAQHETAWDGGLEPVPVGVLSEQAIARGIAEIAGAIR